MRCPAAILIALSLYPMLPMLAADPTVVPQGPTFRIESETFSGDTVQPASRRLVLFDAGVIYEMWLDDDRVATLYDPGRERVLLIDREHLEYSEVSTTQLLTVSAQARAQVEQEGRGDYFGLRAEVRLDQSETETPTELHVIEFGDTRYETTTRELKNPAVGAAYYQYAQLAAQLNIYRKTGPPPFARLNLIKAVTDKGRLPLSTTLEVTQGGGLKKLRLRAQMEVIDQLSKVDRERIANIGETLARSKKVPIEAFQQ